MGGGEYQRLRLPKQIRTTNEGHPEIPVIRQLIAIPECDEVNITFQTNSPVYFEDYTVYPAPTYQEVQNPDGTVYKEEVFTIDQTAYNTNSFIPQLTAEIIEVGSIRSQRMAEVWIYPVQFNPVTEQLQVFTDIEVTLSFTNPTTEVSVNTGIFSNICQNVMLNYTEGGIGASINDRSSSIGTVSWVGVTDTSGDIEADYLIIAAPAFFDSQNADLLALAQHRANYNGFDVAIVNVADVISDVVGYPYETEDELYKYIPEQRIRNFLQSVYLNGTAHNTYDGKLGYVLLVGADGDHVSDDYKVVSGLKRHSGPSGWGAKIPSDYYYTCVVPQGVFNWGDFFIGRFSVDSNEKLHNIVNKTVYFETEFQVDNWRQNVTLAADAEQYFENNIDTIETLIPANFNVSNYKYSELGSLIKDSLVNNFNKGQLITFYRGHGGIQTWAGGGNVFHANDLNLLNNDIKQGFVFGIACNNGWLDSLENSIAEYFTTSENGSVMFLGASRITLGDDNNDFSIIIHESIWQNLSHVNGEFILEGQLQIAGSSSYINFGDPALNLMAHGYQITEDVTISGEINISTDVTITNDAMVTLSDDAHIHFDVNGKFIVDEGASLDVGDNVEFTGQSSNNSISIAGNMSLSGECTSDVNLIVKNGSTLTLDSINILRMGETAGITVNPGGKMIVDGGTLTARNPLTSAQNTWKGIFVKGNANLAQSFENQGAVILQNNSIIKNAEIGIKVGSSPSGSPPEPYLNDQGGIIQANNAQFLNNRHDIEFNSYQNTNPQGQPIDNISYFHHCHFTTDDDSYFGPHHESVKLSGIHGIVFNHANFADNRTNLNFSSTLTLPKKGIQALNATFHVYNSNFNNLYYGIYATSHNPNRYFKVYESDFSSYRGIFFNGMDNVVIKNNDFTVIPGYEYDNLSCSDTYGIYIDQSSNFAVENNILISSSDGSTHCGSLGIIARNTGTHTNEIYRNNYIGFSIGMEAIGSNRGISPHQGLMLKCNQFAENAYDIFVAPGNIPSIPLGIRELHGYASNPNTTTLSGNIFGNESEILVSNFVNDGDFISYFHHDLKEPRVKPYIYNGEFRFWEMPFAFDYNTSCPVNSIIPPFTELLAEKQDAQTQHTETEILLQSHIDNGSTELMTQQVEMTGDGDAYTSYMYLMQTSPYLSEEVLSTLSAKEEGFNKAMIRDVLVENPQSAKSEEVNLALDNRLDPLPAYMRWQINNGLYQFSEMEVMRHFMAYQKTRHDRALNRILGGIIRNEEGFENAPPIEDILADIDDIRYQYMLAEWHFGKGDFAQGMQLLGQIEQDFDLSDEALWYAHEDKLSFYNWLAQWDQEEYPGYFGLPEDALQELEAYLDATPRIAGKALSLLMLNEAIEYEEPILYPIMHLNSEPIHHETMPIISEMDEEFSFSLFPNPSKEYITLDWCFDSPQMKGIIEIRNSKGVLMDVVKTEIHCNQRIYPLTHLKSGSYTATLISGSYIRKTLSFIVIK